MDRALGRGAFHLRDLYIKQNPRQQAVGAMFSSVGVSVFISGCWFCNDC